MNWLALPALVLKYGPALNAIWKLATSNADFISKIEAALPNLASLATEIAKEFFPDSAANVQKIAGTLLTLNTKLVQYIQQVCNYVVEAGLEVDGMYGPKTQAAVQKLQEHLGGGLKLDGIWGKLTEAAVEKLNLPIIKP